VRIHQVVEELVRMVPQVLHMRLAVPHVLVHHDLLHKHRATDLVSPFVHLVNNQRADNPQEVPRALVVE